MIFINLKGAIDSEENRVMMELWGGTSEICSVETFRRVLDEHPDEQEVCINIDCDGGSVEEGFKIYDFLRMSGRTIYTNIVGGMPLDGSVHPVGSSGREPVGKQELPGTHPSGIHAGRGLAHFRRCS